MWLSSIWRRLRYLKTFLPQSSLTDAPATMPKLWKAKAGTGRRKKIRFFSRRRSDFENLKVPKFMGPDNIHPQVLREVAEEVAKPLSIVFDKL